MSMIFAHKLPTPKEIKEIYPVPEAVQQAKAQHDQLIIFGHYWAMFCRQRGLRLRIYQPFGACPGKSKGQACPHPSNLHK